jgi:2-polyprenyl-3-methyl-5-hydroxy-6-metoxy-1,4-benzoquinol methylase
MTKREFDQHAKSYSSRINEALAPFAKVHDFFTRRKVSILQSVFASARRDPSIKALDVGCGVGLIHPYLCDPALDLQGIDVSEASIGVARSTNPTVQYQVYGGEALPFETGHFDCAFAICVLHHVPAPQWPNFIEEMRRVVRPGGRILLIEHNPLNLGTQWVVNTCELDENAKLIFPGKMRRLFRGARLEQVRNSYFLFTPFSHPFFKTLDRWFSWLPLGAQYFAVGVVPESPIEKKQPS